MANFCQSGDPPRLTSMGTRDFSAQLVTLQSGIVLDITSSGFNTFGQRERGHVTARLTLGQALELESLLAAAIADADEVATENKQTRLWGCRGSSKGARA